MKTIIKLAVLTIAALCILAFIPKESTDKAPETHTHINWVTMEEAAELANTKPRKVLVDVYTDWCGWCKRMDKATYEDEAVVKYINEHFYGVKFDAEQREAVVLGGRTFNFRSDAGRRGVHELAVAMMDGKMSYPTTIFFDEKLQRITPLPGYQGPKDMLAILHFMKDEVYKNSSDLTGYIKTFKGK
jgi:thioredoxin-related protein